MTGGSERTVFKFQLEIERLITTLLYEEQDSKPLALAQIDDVRFNLSVHPDTLNLTTALGNLKAQDGQLPEVSPLFQVLNKICGHAKICFCLLEEESPDKYCCRRMIGQESISCVLASHHLSCQKLEASSCRLKSITGMTISHFATVLETMK